MEEIGIYKFGPFLIDGQTRTLFKADEIITIRPKLFDLLLFFAENSGRLLLKEEVMENVWKDTFVEEANLVQSIAVLRKILNVENADRLIKTVPKKGYMFTAKVEKVQEDLLPKEKSKVSLAILPFKYQGASSSTLFLSIGLPDSIISKLNSISELIVRQTSSIRKYEGLEIDPVKAGNELYVDYILTGSVERRNQQLQVGLELTDVESKSKRVIGRYDFGLNDFLSLQDKVCEVVFEELMPVGEDEKRRALKPFTRNAEANQLYLNGRYFWNKRTRADFETAIGFFERAVEIDPDYALPYTGIADVYNLLSGYCFLRPHEARPKAKAAALKALEIDDTLGEAYASLGQIKATYEYDWLGAELDFQQAITLNPNYATAYHWMALLLRAKGMFEDSLFLLKRALTLEPFSLSINTAYALTFYYSRDYRKAIEESQKVLELNPTYHVAHCTIGLAYQAMGELDLATESLETSTRLSVNDSELLSLLGQSYGISGRAEDAKRVLEELTELSKIQYVSPMHMASVHAGLGNNEVAISLIEKAVQERDIEVFQLGITPRFDALRKNPIFSKIIRDLNLPNWEALQASI
jgi:DNA-binding winged helix-turn-helix (wHTH) protein/Flp pilus assembly protein TadD